ncbi:alpha/beta hydrolase [Pedobacter sp. MR2016-24]|uniref:alpha/beta hydrolase n=1 Tax=Pedobacter sp. MR2016-24 TaxID=2994466 RepID=UPI0022465BB9|nr:alpha/beta hydrolase [Pedobacter sp. MR2016-24]MCX2482780.1 alpha/beta hydrolase [Pedobacter sp. MR2016-24]
MRLFKKILTGLAVLILLLVIVYFCGPKPATPVYTDQLPVLPADLVQVDQYIRKKENNLPVKADNEARIVWSDSSSKKQTEIAIVYLHGFTASQGEGDPVHRTFAHAFGCNLYLSRLAGHGLKGKDAMLEFTPEHLWASALEAYAIGKKLGREVIIVGTSTGAAVALRLAATFPEIKGIILYSPNIAINSKSAWLMNDPWGLQILRKVMDGKYSKDTKDTDPKLRQYFYGQYRLEALPQLEEYMETSNTHATYTKIKQPVLMLYYYKDETHQDATVKIDVMLQMFDQLGTSAALKRKVAIPNAGNHVIACPALSKDVPAVTRETLRFAKEILHMKSAI